MGSHRLWNSPQHSTPFAAAAAASAACSASVSVMGFVTSTCMPAATASIAMEPCVSSGVKMSTAEPRGSAASPARYASGSVAPSAG